MKNDLKQTASIPIEAFQFFESVPDLYLILSPDLYILTASRLYLQATEKELKEIKGKHLFEVFPDNPILPDADSTANLNSSLNWVLQHKQPHQMALQRYDIPHTDLPGVFKEKYWLPTNTPVLDDEENVLYLIHKVVDVTESLSTQRQIQHLELLSGGKQTGTYGQCTPDNEGFSHKNLYHIFMQMPALVCIMEGAEHVLKLFNPPYQRLLSNRPLLGLPVAKAIPELVSQGIIELMDQVYRTGESLYIHEMKVKLDHRNNGELIDNYYNFTYQAVRDLNGSVYGVMLFANEVSAHVHARQEVEQREQALQVLNSQLEEAQEKLQYLNHDLEERIAERTQELANAIQELKVANEQLRHINADLDNFIYTASHDLKSPIANIEGLMQLLLEELPEEVMTHLHQNGIIQMIANSISRFRQTLQHLTDVVKLQKEDSQEPVVISLESLIHDMKLDLAAEIKATDATLITDVAACPNIHFSPKNLRSIMYNLLSNAIKYRSPERKPEVYISCLQEHDYTVVTVQDNGLGMNLSNSKKLFSMFSRLHDHVEGSGIGLYMVKKIVENAGGRIEVESQVGVGSTFKVYLKA